MRLLSCLVNLLWALFPLSTTELMFDISSTTSVAITQTQFQCLTELSNNNAGIFIRLTDNNGRILPMALANFQTATLVYGTNVFPVVVPSYEAGNPSQQINAALIQMRARRWLPRLFVIAIAPTNNWGLSVLQNRAFIAELLAATRNLRFYNFEVVLFSNQLWWKTITGDANWSETSSPFWDAVWFSDLDGNKTCSTWNTVSFGGFLFPRIKQIANDQMACGVVFGVNSLCNFSEIPDSIDLLSADINITPSQYVCLANAAADNRNIFVRITLDNGQFDQSTLVSFLSNSSYRFPSAQISPVIFPCFEVGNVTFQATNAISQFYDILSHNYDYLLPSHFVVAIQPNSWSNSVNDNRAFIEDLLQAAQQELTRQRELHGNVRIAELMIYSSLDWWTQITGNSNWSVRDLVLDNVWYEDMSQLGDDCASWAQAKFGNFTFPFGKRYSTKQSLCGLNVGSSVRCPKVAEIPEYVNYFPVGISKVQFQCYQNGNPKANGFIRLTQSSGQVDPFATTNIQNVLALSLFCPNTIIVPNFLLNNASGQITSALNPVRNFLSNVSCTPYIAISIEPNNWGSSAIENRAFIIEIVKSVQNVIAGWHRKPELLLYSSQTWWKEITGDAEWTISDLIPNVWYVVRDGSLNCNDWESEAFGGYTAPLLKEYASNLEACGVHFNSNYACESSR